ncbi:acyl-CoA dehydrogenase family protein [candidate division CSSED10-310 bacterium]|uniref:Acyl-CoA dehydrogenase family protein n=1 Tax=candidate division CSSED10-310 bacterium TaxID=2855610 RepID=A0ABV6Z260_UNCC1
MDFDLPNEVKIVKRSTREFAEQVIAPLIDDMEQTGDFPAHVIKEMGDIGLLGLITPQEYGGSDLGFLARTVAIQEISRICAAIGCGLQVHHMEIAGILDWGTKEHKEKYLPLLTQGDYLGVVAVTEPTGGSDLMGMTSTAIAEGNEYVLNGRKCFITNSHYCGAPLLIIKTGDGPRGLSAFIVEKGTPGFSPGRHEHKVGLRGANTGELFLQNCHVPKSNLIGDEGQGMKIALKTISEVGRPGMAAVALGILEACLEEAVKFARERVLYGKPIANLQAIQWNIADIMGDLEACKLLCYRASWLKDNERECAVEMTLAKTYSTEAAVRASKKALEIHGGCGTMMEYTVQRLFRDAMVCISAGGTTEIGKIVLSRAAIG